MVFGIQARDADKQKGHRLYSTPGHLREFMSLSNVKLGSARGLAIKAIAMMLFAVAMLETGGVVVFRSLLDQPLAKTAMVSIICAVLVEVMEATCLRCGYIWALGLAGLIVACVGAFLGYLPAVIVASRPAYAHVVPMELCLVLAGAASGLACWRSVPNFMRKILHN
jgi:hypothetical protein